jgi:DNA invertase Pin-like site-specific DNA recombinase
MQQRARFRHRNRCTINPSVRVPKTLTISRAVFPIFARPQTLKDEGISGAKGRAERPGLDKLLQAVARREFDLVAAWSVDRLGRSLIDLVGVLQELHSKHVDLYLHQQGIDTTTPSGKAMFQMMGVFAEFERSIIHERVMAGLARAKAEGKQSGRRPTVTNDAAKVRAIRSDHKAGKSLREIAKAHGVGHSTVARITAQ